MISTKSINVNNDSSGGKFLPKGLTPGVYELQILSIALQKADFVKEQTAYYLVLNLEGRPIEGFQGFQHDNKDASKGFHNAQTGFVKTGEYTYQNWDSGTGIKKTRDEEILKDIKRLSIALDIEQWFNDADSKFETIEAFVEAFNASKVFAGIFMFYTLAGKEFINKKGYKQYELFLPYPSTLGKAYSKDKSKVQTFFEATHIRPAKVKTNGAVTPLATKSTPPNELPKEPSPFKDEWQAEINKEVPVIHPDIVTGDDSQDLPFELP